MNADKRYLIICGVDRPLITAKANKLWWARVLKWFYSADKIFDKEERDFK